jgi:hypothetical protein
MVFTVQCTVRLAEFTPLTLPAALIMGSKQPHIKYIDTADPEHRADILRDRAIDGLQSAAARVVQAHHAQHGSRLLMGRVTILRRGLLTVSVTSNKVKGRRIYDIEDGQEGRITDVTEQISQALSANPSNFAAASGTAQASLRSRRSFLLTQSVHGPEAYDPEIISPLEEPGRGSYGTKFSLSPKMSRPNTSANLTMASIAPSVPLGTATAAHTNGRPGTAPHGTSASSKRSLKALFSK